jgi:ABC-type tungstate transport system substrate-binding protein
MATETVLDRSGEIAAHASITTETVLPSLSNDASTAALSVLQSVKNTETEIAGVINSSLVRPIIISNTEQAVGAAAGRAAGSSTASRIISGVRTAMKIAGTVK